MKYILSIDQSTSGTKALLFDGAGALLTRADRPHRQKVDEHGWVSHDPMEIYENCLAVCRQAVEQAGISPAELCALGISNQRETSLLWDRDTGLPVADAVVWQCSRAVEITNRLEPYADRVREKTGLRLSPYFPAGKWAWLLENTPGLAGKSLCAGTIDAWLIYKLTGGESFKTDYSNASRTQLFNVSTLCWDDELCKLFGVPKSLLPEVCMSDSCFGETDLGGFLPRPIPIHGVLGDSHGALFGQGCLKPGMAKATYGTGSSVMMNIGGKPVFPSGGVVTSLAWGMNGSVDYVLEGNINYTGSVIKWLAEDVQLIGSFREAGELAVRADPEDATYLVPAFTGLGAPYWKSGAKAILWGMSRSTGRAEIVKAAEECIAYQIADVVLAMEEDSGVRIGELRADGGPTRDQFLMQFQSDLLGRPIAVPGREELSGIGAAYCAGIACGLYERRLLENQAHTRFVPQKEDDWREKKYQGWKQAVGLLL